MLHTTQQSTHVVSGFTTFKLLMEHLDTSQCGLEVCTKTNNLNFRPLGDNASFNTSGDKGTTTRDGKDICDEDNQKTGPIRVIGFLDRYLRRASRTVSRGHLITRKRVRNVAEETADMDLRGGRSIQASQASTSSRIFFSPISWP